MRVLLVDDDDIFRSSMTEMLGRRGIDVIGAMDGAEARRILGMGITFDFIVTDLMMPVENGWEFLDKIKEHGKTPVIILTAWSDKFIEPLPENVVEILPKPCEDLATELLRIKAKLESGC